jgi:hypothetical protein
MSKEIHQRVQQFQKKLGEESKDEYYESQAARLDTIIGGDTAHYIRLRRCKEEYDQRADAVPIGQGFLTFEDFVREWYGVKLHMNVQDGTFGLDYTVVDDKKYTVFLLKFGHES